MCAAALKSANPGLGRRLTDLNGSTHPTFCRQFRSQAYQQMVFHEIVMTGIQSARPGLTIELTAVDTASGALDSIAGVDEAFDLVLMDYCLPGGNSDTVLPQLRKLLGPYAAIIMLSGTAQEASMQRCWLDLGADSYRLKPVSVATVEELISYTFEKRRLLQKRRHPSLDEGEEADDYAEGSERHRSKRMSTSAPKAPSPPLVRPDEELHALPATAEQQPPAIVDLLSNGRLGPVHLTFDRSTNNEPRAMKVYPVSVLRGSPPTPHPHVNRVFSRQIKGEQCIELRELCDGGEVRA